jgi:hypothetical protein
MFINNISEMSNKNYKTFIIKDQIQTYLDFEKWSLLRDIILAVFIYLFYINVDFSISIIVIKYYITLLTIRYLISITTTHKNKNDNTKYFQISGHLSLFMLLILLSTQVNLFNLNTNKDMAWILILIYALLNVAVQKHYSSDILFTILLVYYLYTSTYFKQLFIE